MKTVKITGADKFTPTLTLGVCDQFSSKFLGLMFRKNLEPFSGLIFIEKKPSIINTSIHMLFMNFDITVLWLDETWFIVDKALAKKWHPAYSPKKPAKYTLEIHPERFNDFSIGDTLRLLE